MNGARSGLSADMARRAGVRRALAPLALALVMVGTLAASVPVVALTQADTEPVHRDFSTPDMSQSQVNRDQPRPLESMEGIAQVEGLAERPDDAVLAIGEVRADSQFTSTVLNDDGSYTTEVSLDPVNWQDEAGTWRPFDDTIVAADPALLQVGVAAVCDAGPLAVGCATAAAAAEQGRLISLVADGSTVDVLLPGTQPTEAVAADDVVTFAGAAEGVDLRYRLEEGTLKEEIVLAAPPAEKDPVSFPFELRLGDLSARQNEDGSVDLIDPEGTIVFYIPPSFMLDGDETLEYDERISTDVVMSLSQIAPGRVLLDVRPDPAWLLDPARTYPVIIDPTFHYGNGRSDTASSTSVMIQAANPTTNYNGVSPLTVGKTAGGQAQEALVTFPSLDVIPRDATIVRATLGFTISSGTSGMGLVVMRNTSTWSPSTVTWNTKPSRSTQKSATAAIGANSIVLTQLAHQWARGNYTNHAIGLQSSGSNGQNVVIPASGAGSPALTITYIKQLRLGIDDLYSYTSYDYGGGTVGMVNTATGNLVMQHEASAIGAPGFTVDLTHTFNGQDPYGQKKTNPDSWAVYGEGWSFSQDLRLFEIQSGDATVFKDGTGRIRIFTQLDIQSGIRTYTQPIQYGYTLVKDVNNPVADANKVWTLTATSGGERLFFDGAGRLKRREDRNGNYLTYAYDGSDRLTTITDEISRTTTFTWTAPGSPNRLYRITDMAGRIFEYGYSSYGNLITIKDAVGTSVQRTTTFGYAVADQLTSVTNPNGNQSVVDYGNLHGWEGSTTESWQMASGSTGTVVKSTDRAYTGSGSLKATLGSAGVPLNSEIVRPYSPARSWNSAPQEMIAWIWLSSGAPAINVTMRASNSCSSGTQSVTAALTANAWNEVHLESVDQDPTCPLTELGLRFQTPGGQTYTTPIYVDHLYMRGLTIGVREASGAHTIFQEWSWDPANRQTTIGLRDAAGTMQPNTYRYTEVGQVDRVTDPYSDITTMVVDNDWRMTSITYPGTPTRTDTYSYQTGRMEPHTETVDGDTDRSGWHATTGDLRYWIDPVNEARRAATQAFVATIFNRDAAGNVTSTKLNWYAAGANLDNDPFPAATSTLETTTFTYTSNGEVATTTDANGIVIKDEWDTAGRHTKSIDNFVSGGTDPDENLTTEYDYDTSIIAGKAGWITETTDPIGAVTALSYDALGGLLTSTTTGAGLGAGITTTVTNNANGSIVTETIDGILTEHTYDVNGLLTKVIEDKGSGKLNLTSEFAYDLQGNQIAAKDPRGTIVRHWFDANGLLTKTVANCTTTGTTIPSSWEACTGGGTQDATWNLTATYGYDDRGNLTSEIAPNGMESRHGYDARDVRVWTTANWVSGTPMY